MTAVLKALAFCLLGLVAAGCSSDDSVTWITSTGLEVTEVVRGEGTPPKKGSIVSVHYTAWYVDGDEIQSTRNLEGPHRFRLGMGDVLPGFDEGVSTMRKGGKRILVLPPELAFGAEGRGDVVPPNAWVKLEVELVDIEPPPPTPEPWDDAGLDIIVTNSGLQVVDFEVGEGEQPKIGSTVAVHYAGYLDDGTCFDTSYYSGLPLEFVIGSEQLIDGWLEGLMSMRVGGKRKLIIPPHLGYGEQGFGKKVPPNATLTFDVILVHVENK